MIWGELGAKILECPFKISLKRFVPDLSTPNKKIGAFSSSDKYINLRLFLIILTIDTLSFHLKLH